MQRRGLTAVETIFTDDTQPASTEGSPNPTYTVQELHQPGPGFAMVAFWSKVATAKVSLSKYFADYTVGILHLY